MGPDGMRGNQGNQPGRGPDGNNQGPSRGGPDNLDEQLRIVERIFSSPMIKRYLELAEENAQLRAQVQVQKSYRNANAKERAIINLSAMSTHGSRTRTTGSAC